MTRLTDVELLQLSEDHRILCGRLESLQIEVAMGKHAPSVLRRLCSEQKRIDEELTEIEDQLLVMSY
jgi:hypothetical protein